MNSLYKESTLTEEEQEINVAMDRAMDALNEEKNVMLTALGLNFVGLLLMVFSPQYSSVERVGFAMFSSSIACFVATILFQRRTRRLRREAIEIMKPYQRRKALPFYQELTEMFAEKPGIHIHLTDDGVIVVTDKRKKQGEGQING